MLLSLYMGLWLTHVVSHADLVLGLGGEIQSEYRNVTTIKARRHPALTEFLINFDFAELTYDYENYEEDT